ncbi:MAG: SRPBCC family protein [Pseudomonadota bacterium]
MPSTNSIQFNTTVNLSIEAAFKLFTENFSSWWPSEYSFSQDVLHDIGMELKADGLCYELGPHGFRCDWGRVLEYTPSTCLVLAWHLSPSSAPDPNPAHASEIQVNFVTENAGSTRITVEHRHFDKHGEGWEAYLEEMASEYGWPYLLQCYSEAVGNQ